MLFAWLMFPEVLKGSAFENLGNNTLQHPEDQNFLKTLLRKPLISQEHFKVISLCNGKEVCFL
jgi:hypothetical protein